MEKNIYNLELHEGMRIPGEYYAMRVPGGWLYSDLSNVPYTTVFVPFHNEFRKYQED